MDLEIDAKDTCSSCGAEIRWVTIKTKDGELKPHPLSAALTKRDGAQVYMGSHFADCPNAARHRR